MSNHKVTFSRVVLAIIVALAFFLCACANGGRNDGFNCDYYYALFVLSAFSAWALIALLTDTFTFIGMKGKQVVHHLMPRTKA